MNRKYQAFTLVELLVVIAIIGILVALLLPAIQSAREAARRSSCQSNLHNVALALLNYHSAKQTFPQGFEHACTSNSAAGDCSGDGLCAFSWGAYTLPYMEESTLYDKLHVAQTAAGSTVTSLQAALNSGDPGVVQSLQSPVPAFRCASDDGGTLTNEPELYGAYSFGAVENTRSNYGGVFGNGRLSTKGTLRTQVGPLAAFTGCAPKKPEGDGVFYRSSKVSAKKITDGLSHTFIVGERTSRLRTLGDPSAANLAVDADFPGAFCLFGVTSNNIGYSTLKGAQQVTGYTGTMQVDNVLRCPSTAPTDSPLVLINDTFSRIESRHGFNSSHPGGAHFAMADGAVRFVSTSVDTITYGRLGGRSDGEPLREDF